MAIQLNDRDHLIFKFIEEHQVLLEKHISWFISSDEKPVLIRDRLRKLFYLDYLLCQRHPDTLPWWSTPTKPLVYMLSPMTRELIGSERGYGDSLESVRQRHYLELANIRMLYLVAEKEGLLQELDWSIVPIPDNGKLNLDVIASYLLDGKPKSVGIINDVRLDEVIHRVEASLTSHDLSEILVVSRDDKQQRELMLECLDKASPKATQILGFSTHQDLYKTGILKAKVINLAGANLPIRSNA